ncbi:hypothetical protein D3C80_1437220 [compost metagenome]
MQALQADFAKLAEHLEVTAIAGQDAARLEQQLVQVPMQRNAGLRKYLADSLVSASFVDAILFVQVQCLYPVLATYLQQHRRRLRPVIGLADQQGNIQFSQPLAHFAHIA